MRIALIGAGALGTIIGAVLSKSGEDIVLVDTYQAHVDELNRSGATIVDHLDLKVPVKAITPDRMDGIYDLFIYLVKSTADESALPKILKHMDENSFVVTMQNGVPEEKVAAYVGKERTVGCVITFSATFIRPGTSALTSQFFDPSFIIGELDGTITPRLQNLKSLFPSYAGAKITDNLMGERWKKLRYNASCSAMSVILNDAIGAPVGNPDAVRAVALLLMEITKVANALEISMGANFITDLEDYRKILIEEGEEKILQQAERLIKANPGMVASMLQSLRDGKPCEVDSINGYLQKKAEETGISTPVNTQIVDIIRGMNEGKIQLGAENLKNIKLFPLAEILKAD